MNTFRSFFIFELRRFFGKRNIILIFLLLFLSLALTQISISEYKNTLNRKEKFQEIERTKVSQYISYTQYGGYGVRMLFVPAPISLFFMNSCVIPDMTSYVDSGERLKIYNTLKGKNLFDQKKFGFSDFSGIILFFGSLLALFYGYETFNNSDYLKFLSSISTKKHAFYSVLLSRIVMMFLVFLAITGSALLLTIINGLYIPTNVYFLYFILSILIFSLFFFSIGTIIGMMRSKIIGITTVLSCWFILLYFIPTAINTYIASRSDLLTPVYKLEIDKLKILMDFERKAIEKSGIFKEVDDSERENALSYLNNELKQILSLEGKMRDQMKNNISIFQKLSMFFPPTFYLSVTNEISSRGYENLIDFYNYVQSVKREFVTFYTEKMFFSNFSEIEPFLKGDKNVFYAQSRLPGNFTVGVLVNLFYIAALFWVSYSRFRKALFGLPHNVNSGSPPRELKLKKGEFTVLVSEGDLLKNQLYNLWSGETGELQKKGYTIKISIDDHDISSEKSRENFFYICHPENIPGDINAGDFLYFIRRLKKIRGKEAADSSTHMGLKSIEGKRFNRLKNHEKGEIILKVLRMNGTQIYLLHDIARGMPIEFTIQLKKRMDELKEEGALVIYLTPDELINLKSIKKGRGFYASTTWGQLVDHYKELLDIE